MGSLFNRTHRKYGKYSVIHDLWFRNDFSIYSSKGQGNGKWLSISNTYVFGPTESCVSFTVMNNST